MVKATVIDVEKVAGVDRIRVKGIVVFGGGRETISPKDVGLKTIDFIGLMPMARTGGFPCGSLSYKGSPVTYPAAAVRGYGRLSGRPGSSATLFWRVGSGPGDTVLGSVGTGSKTAFFDIVGT